MLLAATQYPIKTQKIFPSPPLLRQQHSVKAREKNQRDAQHFATLPPESRQRAVSAGGFFNSLPYSSGK
ncbi:MAG: hypothetical protein IJR28_04000, partial [Ottowia sp.]|nr:hypothetical protein [Ottowia sp.]